MNDLDDIMDAIRTNLARKRSPEEWAALSAQAHKNLENANKSVEMLSGDPDKAQAFIDATYKKLTGL